MTNIRVEVTVKGCKVVIVATGLTLCQGTSVADNDHCIVELFTVSGHHVNINIAEPLSLWLTRV